MVQNSVAKDDEGNNITEAFLLFKPLFHWSFIMEKSFSVFKVIAIFKTYPNFIFTLISERCLWWGGNFL